MCMLNIIVSLARRVVRRCDGQCGAAGGLRRGGGAAAGRAQVRQTRARHTSQCIDIVLHLEITKHNRITKVNSMNIRNEIAH